MKDELYKRYQNKLNAIVKEANKSLDEDNLWMGRFQVRQIRSRFERFDDNSGGILHTIFRVVDKKTEQYKDYVIEYAPWLSTFYWHFSMDILNDFVVECLDVWRKEKPREEIKDWTNVEIPEYIFNKRTSNKWVTHSLYQLTPYDYDGGI